VINDVEKTFVYNVSMRRYLVNYVESMLQDEIYCTQVINDVEKMFIYSDSKERYSVDHVESMLQDEIYCT